MATYIHPLPGFFEPFSALSHLLGALVFTVLGVVLLRRGEGDARRVLFLGVFAVASILLLSMSGVFHMLERGSTGRNVLGRLDKAAIFALIAGTHTPVQGLFFQGLARWGVLAVMWLVAITGITLFSVFYDSVPRGLGTAVYLVLGWIASMAAVVVWRRHCTSRVWLLLLGGVIYSAGAISLGFRWPTIWPGVLGPHELWHVAVLTAMALHWKFFFENARQPMDTGDEPAVRGAGERQSPGA